MRRLFVEKKIIKILHKKISVFLKVFVLVWFQEFGSNIQIKEVKKINKNLSFSKSIIEFLSVLHVKNLDEIVISISMGKFEKFIFILKEKGMKN